MFPSTTIVELMISEFRGKMLLIQLFPQQTFWLVKADVIGTVSGLKTVHVCSPQGILGHRSSTIIKDINTCTFLASQTVCCEKGYIAHFVELVLIQFTSTHCCKIQHTVFHKLKLVRESNPHFYWTFVILVISSGRTKKKKLSSVK